MTIKSYRHLLFAYFSTIFPLNILGVSITRGILNTKKVSSSLGSACLLWIIFFTSIVAQPSASSTTTVYVVSPSNTVVVGQRFIVKVNISEVSDLYGWEFRLRWNPNLLDIVEVTEGSFLKQGGDTFFSKKTNNTEGSVLVDCTLLGDVSGVNGNGTLAVVTFYAKVQGESVLDLYETTLINSREQPIAHIATDGNVSTGPRAWSIVDLLEPYVSIIVILILIAGMSSAGFWFFKLRREKTRQGKGETTVQQFATLRLDVGDDEEKVVTLLKSAGGRLYQSTLTNKCGFSRSKTSKLLKFMESRGKIRREKRGREKVVILVDKVEGTRT